MEHGVPEVDRSWPQLANMRVLVDSVFHWWHEYPEANGAQSAELVIGKQEPTLLLRMLRVDHESREIGCRYERLCCRWTRTRGEKYEPTNDKTDGLLMVRGFDIVA